MIRRALVVVALLLVTGAAQAEPPSLERKVAPPWGLSPWFGLPSDGKTLEPSDLRGRVVCLTAVDAESPEGLAAFRATTRPRLSAKGLAFACVLLPGSSPVAPEAARRLTDRLGVPVAAGGATTFAKAYGPPTRPWTWILDRRGVVRFSGPTPDEKRLGLLVDALRGTYHPTCPLVGKPFGDLSNLRFHGTDGHEFAEHPLTLFRWWTLHCPHCNASVPALAGLAELEQSYADRGLAFVPVYHVKSGRHWSPDDVRIYLAHLGYRGTFATDPDWQKLGDLMGRARFHRETHVSLLVDAKGKVVWAHPGPRIHASEDARHAEPDAHLRALEALIDEHLPRR